METAIQNHDDMEEDVLSLIIFSFFFDFYFDIILSAYFLLELFSVSRYPLSSYCPEESTGRVRETWDQEHTDNILNQIICTRCTIPTLTGCNAGDIRGTGHHEAGNTWPHVVKRRLINMRIYSII